MHSLPNSIPVMPICVALFVSFMHQHGYAGSTIATYLSPISYVHKIQSLPDPIAHFLVQKALIGVRNLTRVSDIRLPITLPLLDRMCQCLPIVCGSPYNRCLYKAMFLLAFFGFLRVGEMCCTNGPTHNILSIGNIVILPIEGISITFTHYKHSKGKRHIIKVSSRGSINCPVKALQSYIYLRGQQPGPLFATASQLPVSRNAFTKILRDCINFLGMDSTFYKSHSFRIGAATYAAQCGMSDDRIRYMGRWASQAFIRYIRLG